MNWYSVPEEDWVVLADNDSIIDLFGIVLKMSSKAVASVASMTIVPIGKMVIMWLESLR